LETDFGDGEVNECYFNSDFGQVMGIGEFRCHEEPKVGVINDFIFTQFHQQGSSFLLGIFLKNRFKERIKRFFNVFQHTRRAKSDTGLNRSLVVFATEFNYL
jgi:hypothetical protein